MAAKCDFSPKATWPEENPVEGFGLSLGKPFERLKVCPGVKEY